MTNDKAGVFEAFSTYLDSSEAEVLSSIRGLLQESATGCLPRGDALAQVRRKYTSANRRLRGRMLSVIAESLRCHRKHATRLMSCTYDVKLGHSQRSPAFGSKDVRMAIAAIHKFTGKVGARRLAMLLPEWIPSYVAKNPLVDPGRLERLKSISHATISRLLRSSVARTAEVGMEGDIAKLLVPLRSPVLSTIKPTAVGCIVLLDCNFKGPEGESRAGLLAIDALSGWVGNMVRSASGPFRWHELESQIPFPITGIIYAGSTQETSLSIREWAWTGVEPREFVSADVGPSLQVPAVLFSEHFRCLANHGLFSVSPHSKRLTPRQALSNVGIGGDQLLGQRMKLVYSAQRVLAELEKSLSVSGRTAENVGEK